MRFAIAVSVGLLSIGYGWAKDRPEYQATATLGIEAWTLKPGLEDVAGAPKRPGAWVVSPRYTRPPVAPADNPTWDFIMAGDLIVAFNGRKVWSAEDLAMQLLDRRPGERVQVAIVRDGKEYTVTVKLKEAPPAIFLPAETCAVPTGGTIFKENFASQALFGIQMTAQSREELAGQCSVVLEACSAMRFVKQTTDRTVIELNGNNFFIEGDWTKHTHSKYAQCKAEQEQLAEQAAARRAEFQAPQPNTTQ